MSSRGDQDALFAALEADARQVVRRWVRDSAAVDDLVQDTLLKLYEHLGELREPEAARGWVRTAARRAVIDAHRRRRWVFSDPEPLAPEVEDWSTEAMVASWLPAFLETLPEPYRQAVRWADLEGVPQTEIAQRLGLSASGAKSRVQRGRRMLKARLLDCCHVEMARGGHVVELRHRESDCCAG